MSARTFEVADGFEANRLFAGNGRTDGLHDAITAEKAGIPAVAIMTDAFTATADALAIACGIPAYAYAYAVIPHPIAADDDEALRHKAAEALRQCHDLLVRR